MIDKRITWEFVIKPPYVLCECGHNKIDVIVEYSPVDRQLFKQHGEVVPHQRIATCNCEKCKAFHFNIYNIIMINITHRRDEYYGKSD